MVRETIEPDTGETSKKTPLMLAIVLAVSLAIAAAFAVGVVSIDGQSAPEAAAATTPTAGDTSGIYADPAGTTTTYADSGLEAAGYGAELGGDPAGTTAAGSEPIDAGGYGEELGGDPAGYSEHGIDENGDGGLDAGGYGDELGGDPAGR